MIIGLDLAENLGYCVLDDAGPRILAAGRRRLARRDPNERLLALRDFIHALLERFGHHGDMVLEDVFLPSKTSRRTPIALGELRGVARLCAVEVGMPVHFYPPARVKMAVVGSGRATKSDMIALINSEFRRSVSDDNEADAIALAYTHWLMRRLQMTPAIGTGGSRRAS